MSTRYYLFIILWVSFASTIVAQHDAHLRQLTESVKELRKARASKAALNKAVLDWSQSGQPKITLMDEIGRDSNEYRGDGFNKFKINQLVTYVYERQNKGMVSKGDYFNSTEQDIYYSAIEKSIKKGKTINYALSGHLGQQEFIFVSYNPKSKYEVKVNGKTAKNLNDGIHYMLLDDITKDDKITFSITYGKENVAAFESFVILNHNPQKK